MAANNQQTVRRCRRAAGKDLPLVLPPLLARKAAETQQKALGAVRVVVMTPDELEDLMADVIERYKETQAEARRAVMKERRLLKGIKGIAKEFGVSESTAQKWKSSWLAPAVSQRCRTIRTDADLAHQLYEEQYMEG